MRMIAHALQHSQILRFVVVGTVNTAFSYGIYAAMLFVGFNFAVANLVALVLGILFSFKTQGALVFRNSDPRLLGRFVVGWAIIYGATIALIGQFIAFGLSAYAGGALALPFSTALSYLLQKHFVFQTPSRPRPTRDKRDPEKTQ